MPPSVKSPSCCTPSSFLWTLDPLRVRVLSGIFHPLHHTFPSLFLNITIETSVLIVVGYPHAGLPTSEKRGQGLALEYSRQLCCRSSCRYFKRDAEVKHPGQVPCSDPALSTTPHLSPMSSSLLFWASPMLLIRGSPATFSSEHSPEVR